MRNILIPLIATSVSLSALPAFALSATQTVEKEVLIQNPDGTETRVRAPFETATPGDRVVYSVRVYNDTDEAASALVFTQPVPSEISYIEGSAERAGAELTVSVDGGETFTRRGAAMVMREGAAVRASAEDITHLRWTLAKDLAPGSEDVVAYKGVLK